MDVVYGWFIIMFSSTEDAIGFYFQDNARGYLDRMLGHSNACVSKICVIL